MKSRLMLGDCLELMKGIPDNSVDMILCDLPYGTTACRWDTIIPFELLWPQYSRVIKKNAAIVLTSAQPFTTVLVHSNIKLFRYEWIWLKNKATNYLHAKTQPMRKHESVLVFGTGRLIYNPQNLVKVNAVIKPSIGETHSNRYIVQKNKSPYIKEFTGYPISTLPFPLEKNGTHPTQKPVALFEYLIKTYTNEGMTVMDSCSGSGTTAIACINTDRNYICIEKDETYFKIARERVAMHLCKDLL